MDFHTFSAENADRLEDAAHRYRYLSAEELLWGIGVGPGPGPGPDHGSDFGSASDGDGTDAVVDLGSGTGFYTRDVAPHVDSVYAVDVQEAMHDHFRDRGVPGNVALVTSDTDPLPFDDDSMDAVFTTMTFHELPRAAVDESARVLAPGGRFVVADWAATGRGESGPPVDERLTADAAASILRDSGFEVAFEAVRTETFLLVGAVGGE